MPGQHFHDLPADFRRYIENELKYNADIVKGIEDPKNPEHLHIASDLFWRLQQGEKLNAIETAHARLSSPVRNFLVKFADDYTFDHKKYEEVDPNPDKHIFFKETYTRTNSHMQHLALLGRFLLLEQADGPTRIGDGDLVRLINDTRRPDGLGNLSFAREKDAKDTLATLTRLHGVFRDDPALGTDARVAGILAFRREYFTISCYLLLRHLLRNYVYTDEERLLFREFIYCFFDRTEKPEPSDDAARQFVEFTQQDQTAVTERDQVIRHEFFIYAAEQNHNMLAKDSRRSFNEAERIAIFRQSNGHCQMCLDEGKPELEARVYWKDFEADHIIPHSIGGRTEPWNGQVLCRTHNRSKGATA